MPNYTLTGGSISASPTTTLNTRGTSKRPAEGRLVVKKCSDCGLLRGEPGPALPLVYLASTGNGSRCRARDTIYSYQVVAHTVIPSFRDLTPFAIVLVELDEQRGQPTEFDGLRITGNLVDRNFNMEKEENVGIGKRVEVAFQPGDDGFMLPQWRLLDEPDAEFAWSHEAPAA